MTAVVGAIGYDPFTAPTTGQAYVLTKSAGTWTQATLGTGTATNEYYGYSVSVSGDGMTAVVGAWGYNPGNAVNTGRAYVFPKSVSGWDTGAILGTGIQNAQFGHSVSVSGDGTTAVVGAKSYDGAAAITGQAYVFTKSGGIWNSGAILGTGTAGSAFGISVSVSDDGKTAVVGAFTSDIGSQTSSDQTYVFTKSGSGWGSGTVLGTAPAGATGYGYSVSVSGDGTTAVVGATGYNPGSAAYSGRAYVLTFA